MQEEGLRLRLGEEDLAFQGEVEREIESKIKILVCRCALCPNLSLNLSLPLRSVAEG